MDSPELQNLQGADYFNWIAKNDPDPAKRKGALTWLALHSPANKNAATGSIAKTVIEQPSQKSFKDAVKESIISDPRFKDIITDPSQVDNIIGAYNSGNWNGITKSNGQPVSAAEANDEITKQLSVLEPAFAAEKSKDTMDLADKLANEQAQYNNYLDTSAANFQGEKATQDKTAADNGVLFSSGRREKLNNLATKYANDAALKKNTLASSIAGDTRDYAYKYGSGEANNPSLSSYFAAPTQSLLQKWLRDLHGVDIHITRNKPSYREYRVEIYKIDNTPNYIHFQINTEKSNGCKWFDDYEKALEEGLLRALKLIK